MAFYADPKWSSVRSAQAIEHIRFHGRPGDNVTIGGGPIITVVTADELTQLQKKAIPNQDVTHRSRKPNMTVVMQKHRTQRRRPGQAA